MEVPENTNSGGSILKLRAGAGLPKLWMGYFTLQTTAFLAKAERISFPVSNIYGVAFAKKRR